MDDFRYPHFRKLPFIYHICVYIHVVYIHACMHTDRQAGRQTYLHRIYIFVRIYIYISVHMHAYPWIWRSGIAARGCPNARCPAEPWRAWRNTKKPRRGRAPGSQRWQDMVIVIGKSIGKWRNPRKIMGNGGLPSGKNLHYCGKSTFLIGKLTVNGNF